MTPAQTGKTILEHWRVILKNYPNRHLSIVNEERRAVINLVDTLEACIRDTDWMARRYSDGSRTYAPSLYNDSKRILMALGFALRLDPISGTPWARDGSGARYGNLSSEEHALGIPLGPFDIHAPLSPDALVQRDRLLLVEEELKLLKTAARAVAESSHRDLDQRAWELKQVLEGLER